MSRSGAHHARKGYQLTHTFIHTPTGKDEQAAALSFASTGCPGEQSRIVIRPLGAHEHHHVIADCTALIEEKESPSDRIPLC